jgi:hypothetical protein
VALSPHGGLFHNWMRVVITQFFVRLFPQFFRGCIPQFLEGLFPNFFKVAPSPHGGLFHNWMRVVITQFFRGLFPQFFRGCIPQFFRRFIFPNFKGFIPPKTTNRLENLLAHSRWASCLTTSVDPSPMQIF